MKRNYTDGESQDAQFFVGKEVEHTPAFGLNTLFVVGIQHCQDINDWLDDFNNREDKTEHVKHIFFGANHSFNPKTYDEWHSWEEMISTFLQQDYLCSLDIPISAVDEFHDGGLCEYNNFIPQIRIPLPYVRLWNYNTMLKLDDKDFNATNPGVWSHSLHKLMNRDCFTDWSKYNQDKELK